TNDFNDAWFAGYTPDLLAVVWVGFDRPQSLGLTGAGAALPIWTRFMKAALADKAPADFPVPSGIVFRTIDRETGGLATAGCRAVVREAFVAGEEPTEPCPVHRQDRFEWPAWPQWN
ncbi:MAG: penicillin-binding protein, partial [Deltaproteobacteria bacterium]